MPDNVPENVDLDELFNHIDPELLQAVLVMNMTHTIKAIARMAADTAIPVGLSRMIGIQPTPDAYEKVLTSLMKGMANITELAGLIQKIVPINDEGLSEERIEEIKESVSRHPIIVEAAFLVTETLDQKLARRDR